MANQNFSFVEDLNPTRDFWNIKIRVIKKWCQSWRLDLIAIDERGSKIQMFVKDALIPNFVDKLQEDGVYIIRRCGVGEQADKYPVLPLKKKINFYRCTEVEPAIGFQGHPYGFLFKSFPEIDHELSQTVLTVDVIGNMVWCGDLDIFKTKTGKETKRIHLDLQDLQDNVLRCTLWGDYAVQVSNYVTNHKSEESVIVVLQHAKIRFWSNSISVQNDMYGTRIFIDDEIEDINNFRRSLILKLEGVGNSQSHFAIQTNYPVRNEFITNAVRKTVEEIRELPMFTEDVENLNESNKVECVVLGSIRLLEEENGWFYVACRECKKKVKTKVEYLKVVKNITEELQNAPSDSVWCEKCECQAISVIPKFRIQFRVQDATGSSSFLMLDHDVCRLLSLSATDIRERQLKSENPNAFPHELDGLINRLLAFKIAVTPYNVRNKYYVFTVIKACDDPDIIDEMIAQDVAPQLTPNPPSVEPTSVKLSENSQCGVDSKDAASVTGGGLAMDIDKDYETSPLLKRPIQVVIDAVNAPGESSTKRLKKKLEPYDV